MATNKLWPEVQENMQNKKIHQQEITLAGSKPKYTGRK